MESIKQEQKKIISDELLDILACPKCKGDLVLVEKNSGLICETCKLFYKIEDGIPIMLVDEAISLDKMKNK